MLLMEIEIERREVAIAVDYMLRLELSYGWAENRVEQMICHNQKSCALLGRHKRIHFRSHASSHVVCDQSHD